VFFFFLGSSEQLQNQIEGDFISLFKQPKLSKNLKKKVFFNFAEPANSIFFFSFLPSFVLVLC